MNGYLAFSIALFVEIKSTLISYPSVQFCNIILKTSIVARAQIPKYHEEHEQPTYDTNYQKEEIPSTY